MTAPELVEVVAEALFAHDWPDEDLAAECGAYSDDYRDAARAVLTALTEAGEVEWGVRNLDGPDPMWKSTDRAAVEKEVNRFPNYRTLVSRLTLPWTAAE